MLTSLRIIGGILFGLVLLAGTAWAATAVIQGDVKGPNGKPIEGAHVTIALKDAKGSAGSAKSDGQGHYVLKDLAMGTYNISVNADGMAATTANDVKPRADSPLRVDFNLKKQNGPAGATTKTGKKATHMVWVPSQTGSNLGGRWVEVDDNSNVVGTDNLQTTGSGTVKRLQSNSGVSKGGGN